MTERETLKALQPGQWTVLPVQDGARLHGLKRLSSIGFSLWGSGYYRTALVADGVYVLRYAEISPFS
jgi:hypothetical protein